MVDSVVKLQNADMPDAISTTNTSTAQNLLPHYSLDVEFQMARLWQKKGKFDRAIAGYQKVLATAPTHWLSLEAVGELLVVQGDAGAAVDLYRKAIQHQAVNAHLQQAMLYQQSGKLDQAVEEYQSVLEVEPLHGEALRELEKVLMQKGDVAAAITACRQALLHNPNDADLHKRHVNLMMAEEGLEAAFEHYDLERKDAKNIEISASDLLCCVVVRNEFLRLPYFLNYYRHKGVSKFFIVDNQSADETLDYLLQQPDVYVWSSAKSFNQVNFGSVWFELLLRRYGIDCWCLTVDADELLYYPDCERKTIPQLCQELDQKHYKAYSAILLDMYADKVIQDTHCTLGQDFLEICPYFDRQYYHREHPHSGPYGNQTVYFGGFRERIFGAKGSYLLNKVPLLKYEPEVVINGGQHFINLPESKIAKGSGCLLHFKYFSRFPDYVAQEVQRREHYGSAQQYLEYSRTLSSTPTLNPYDENHSVLLQNSQQLVEFGILRVEPNDQTTHAVQPPKISLLPAQVHRPFWSVMITAYKRTQYLEQALRSVLEQAPDPSEMQIEVINDGASEPIQDEIAAIVDRVGQGRASFYRHPENVGHPHIFNLCIQRAQGQWIHLLHDDDWVAPGFYAALQRGIEQSLEVGSAFCRCKIMDDAGRQHWISPLERGTPGIIPNWLERIATHCQLQFPAVVVKREAYERLGGFSSQANSAFDWEMWQRIAMRYSVWYEPQPLAYFCKHADAESHHLIESGQQIADSRKVIELAQAYLPRTTAESLSSHARERYALWALQIAKQHLQQGKCHEAIVNISEALQCSQAVQVQRTLANLFLETKGQK